MPATYSCPACGAPLDPSSVAFGNATCGFCHRAVALPARAAASAGTAGSASGSVGLEAELRALLAREQKIEAIKRYREASGSSLRVAKDAVEALEAGRGLPSPADVARTEAKPSERPSAGCVLLLLVLVAGAALAVAMAS